MHEPGQAGHPRAEPAAWFVQGAAVLSFSIRPLVVRRRPSVRNKMGFFKHLFGVAMRHDSQFKRLRASISHKICRQSLRVTKSRKLVGSPFRSESQTLAPCKRLRLLISSLRGRRAILSSPPTTTGAVAPVHVPCARPAFPSSNPAPSGWSTALRRTASAS